MERGYYGYPQQEVGQQLCVIAFFDDEGEPNSFAVLCYTVLLFNNNDNCTFGIPVQSTQTL